MLGVSNLSVNHPSRNLIRAVAILAFALVISGCTSLPQSEFKSFDSIVLLEGSEPTPTKTVDSSGQQYATDPTAEVEIDDQSGDGTFITIDEIELTRGNAFLVVYNLSGIVLAEAFVTPQSQPVTLMLDAPLSGSQQLQATLYLDNGDGVFELDLDLPILGEEGELVHESFWYSVGI